MSGCSIYISQRKLWSCYYAFGFMVIILYVLLSQRDEVCLRLVCILYLDLTDVVLECKS